MAGKGIAVSLHRRGQRWFGRSAIATLGLIAVLTPWTIRNYRVLGILTPVRDNFWLECEAGNNGKTFESNDRWVDFLCLSFPKGICVSLESPKLHLEEFSAVCKATFRAVQRTADSSASLRNDNEKGNESYSVFRTSTSVE